MSGCWLETRLGGVPMAVVLEVTVSNHWSSRLWSMSVLLNVLDQCSVSVRMMLLESVCICPSSSSTAPMPAALPGCSRLSLVRMFCFLLLYAGAFGGSGDWCSSCISLMKISLARSTA